MKKKEKIKGVHLWLLLWKAFRAVEENAAAHIASLGLCVSDFAVLEAVLHKGPLPVNEIGRKVFLTSGAITSAVDRLEKMGYARRGSAGDRRVRLVHLTPAGRKMIRSAFSEHARVMEKAASPLDGRERETLSLLLKKLGKEGIGKAT